MTPEEFFGDLSQDVIVRAEASGNFTDGAFTELVTEYLIDAGTIEDFVPCQYIHRGTRVDGYFWDADDGVLELYIVDCRKSSQPERMSKAEMEQDFRRVEAFFVKAASISFSKQMETSHPAFGLARMILESAAEIKHVRYYLLTNALLTASIKELKSRTGADREWSYRVWDLARLARTVGTGEAEEIIIDFVDLFKQALICLPADDEAGDVHSYLAVIPGDWLARIYDLYGGRLLEQNVRTFLQARGKVNKGIRKTILEEPHRFFTYNNGIAATAESVDKIQEGGVTRVRALRNLQIVNGGQTTASIFNAMKKDRGAPIERVSVPMKLTVVAADIASELVPKISRFANSQNRISDSDFFSNHPFHVVMQNLSSKIAAPAQAGSQILTHWFYERAKGQYANASAYLSPAKKKEFLARFPRSQVISKTDLAKYIQTFRERPHEVSLGAQKNFAKFADVLREQWDRRQSDFNEVWFRRAVCETILFRSAEKIVQGAPWYAQGYRAQVVTYSLALLLRRVRSKGLDLDVQKIWREQAAGAVLEAELLALGKVVQDALIDGARANGVINVTEWCKQKRCFDAIMAVPFTPSKAVLQCFRTADDDREEVIDARREQRALTAAEIHIEVVNLGAEYWKGIMKKAIDSGEIMPPEIALLEVACSMPRRIPTERQCLKLHEIRNHVDTL